MPLADLLRSLEQDAAGQVRAVLAHGEAAAEQVDTEATRSRDDQLARAAGEHRATCQCTADARIAQAQHAARTRVLEARAAMLARVLDDVRAALPASLPAAAPALARAAIAHAGAREGVVRCTPAIVDDVRAAAAAHLHVEASSAVRAGVVIDVAGGTQIVATLDALLEREWPRLAAALLAQLGQENRS